MSLPSGYQQITTGIQFRSTTTSFRNFEAYIDTGCNGLTSGPEGTVTVNGLSYEVRCRRDMFSDSMMSIGSQAMLTDNTKSFNSSRYAPVMSLYSILSGRTYTRPVVTKEVQKINLQGNLYLDQYRLNFLRNNVSIAVIEESPSGDNPTAEYIDPYSGDVFATRLKTVDSVTVLYIPDACFGINLNTDYNLLFNIPDDIEVRLEVYYAGAWMTVDYTTVSYDPQIKHNFSTSVFNAINTKLKCVGNASTYQLYVDYSSGHTFTYDNMQYTAYNVNSANSRRVGYLYAYSNGSMAGIIVGNVPTSYWTVETHNNIKYYYVNNYYETTYFNDELRSFYGTKSYNPQLGTYESDFITTSLDYPNYTYKLYSKYNGNNIVSQYISYNENTIHSLSNVGVDSVQSTIPAWSSPNIIIGSKPSVGKAVSASDQAVTDYILEVKVWDENDILIADIVPVLNEVSGEIGFYDLIKNEMATVVLGNHGEYMSGAGEVAILHNMPKAYAKIGNTLQEFKTAYIKNGSLIKLTSSSIMEVKQI